MQVLFQDALLSLSKVIVDVKLGDAGSHRKSDTASFFEDRSLLVDLNGCVVSGAKHGFSVQCLLIQKMCCWFYEQNSFNSDSSQFVLQPLKFNESLLLNLLLLHTTDMGNDTAIELGSFDM